MQYLHDYIKAYPLLSTQYIINSMRQEYNSEEDEDYQPLKKQERQFEMDQMFKANKKNRGSKTKINISEAWQELKQQTKIVKKPQEPKLSRQQMLQLSIKVLNNSQIKRQKKVIFAGKQFILDQITGEMRQVQKMAIQNHEEQKKQQGGQTTQKQMLQRQYGYLNHVIYTLQQRYRNINSMHKSKMDWKNFVKKEGIQEKLSFNRKGGALQDVRFMKRTEQHR